MTTASRWNRLICIAGLTCGSTLLPIGQAWAGEDIIFGEPQLYATGSHFATAAGDFDGDGDIDLVTAKPPRRNGFGVLVSHGAYAFHGNNGAAAAFSNILIDGNHGGYAVAAGDLNNDGHLDLVSSNTIDIAGNLVNVLMGNGNGSFASLQSYADSASDAAQAIALGDMDNDGDLDMVVPNGGRVWLNDGTGVFFTNFVGSDVRDGASIALGDLNSDGHLDVVSTIDNYVPARTEVAIQLGVGDGFGNPGAAVMIDIGGGSPSAVALGDMNGDGHLDLLTLNRATDDISVLIGYGDGTFSLPFRYAPHTASNFVPNTFVVADLNTDGHLDVVVTSTVYGVAESHEETGIMFGDSDGLLTLNQTIERFGQLDENIVAADLDGDGDVDLATASDILINNLNEMTLTADFDGNGAVDFGDLLSLLSTWGICGSSRDCPTDLDGNGEVGFGDLLILLAQWS